MGFKRQLFFPASLTLFQTPAPTRVAPQVSLSLADVRGGARTVEVSLRAGASPNKRLLFKEDVGPLPHGCKCTPLGFALLSNDADMLQALLAAKADPNKPVGLPHKYDFTPLQLAAALGTAASALAVAKLLAAGADPNTRLQLKTGTTCPPPRPRSASVAVAAASAAAARSSSFSSASGGREGGGGGGGGGTGPQQPEVPELVPARLHRTRVGDTALHIAVDAGGDGGVALSPSRRELLQVRVRARVSMCVCCDCGGSDEGRECALPSQFHARGMLRRDAALDQELRDGAEREAEWSGPPWPRAFGPVRVPSFPHT